MRGVRQLVGSIKKHLTFIGIIVGALIVKTLFSTVTFSSDFQNLALMASFSHVSAVFAGPYTFTRYLMNVFYRIWLWLPLEHVEPLKAFKLIRESPTAGSVSYILALKTPMLLFDFLTGIILYKSILALSRSRRDATIGMAMWLFNPYLTLSIEMDGTIDIVSAFFLTLGVYLFIKEKWALAGLSLAVGTFARFYPLTVLPFFLLTTYNQDGRFRALRILTGFFGGFAVTTLPFIVRFRSQFFNMLLTLSVGGNKEFTWFFGHFFTVMSPPEAKISVVAILYTLLLILLLVRREASNQTLVDAIIILLVGFLAFSHWNRYYSVWIAPLVTLDFTTNRRETGKIYTSLFILLFLGWFLFGARWHITNFFWIQYIPEVFIPLRIAVVETWKWVSAGYLIETFSRAILAAVSVIYMVYISVRDVFNRLNSLR
jgi:hypothetical protein